MKRLLKQFRLSENIEVLFMLTLGIVLQTTDGSPFTIRERWMTVWDTELPPEHFSLFTQQCIKMILSCIVVGRGLTTYLYVMSAMLVMFSIIKDSLPGLMLFWLLIAGLKSVLMTFIEALTGVYVCSAFGKIRKACVEFFISKALEIIFAAYLWGSVLSIHHEIVRKEAEKTRQESWTETRPRARSLLDESTLYKTARLNSFEFKDVPQIILQMLRREEEMSQDSLLGPGMMLASVSNFGSFADLKTSQSLGELGLLDLKGIRVMGIEEDDLLLPQERALKFLKLNWNDVRKIQETRKSFDSDLFVIDDETWNSLKGSHPCLKKPKQTRPEIVLKGIPRPDSEQEIELLQKNNRRNTIDLKFGFSLFSFIREKDELHTREEEQLSGTETLEDECDEEDDEGSSPLFMSNIREEVAVNRIRLDFVSKKIKGNAYEKLYKEEYMSVIGPEVFDRATKLPKVTVPITSKTNVKTSISLPILVEVDKRNRKKINFDARLEDKWKSLADSFFSLDQEMVDEKQAEIDYTNEFLSSSHSLDEDFYPQEELMHQHEEEINDLESNVEKETNHLNNSDITSTDEEQKESKKIFSNKSLGTEKILECVDSNSFGEVPQPPKDEGNSEETVENSISSCGSKTFYRTRRIKIKRIGKRTSKIPLNQTASNAGSDYQKDGRNDGSNYSGKDFGSTRFCEDETLTRDSKRSIQIKKLMNYFSSSNNGGGCNHQKNECNKRKKKSHKATERNNDVLFATYCGVETKKTEDHSSSRSIKNFKTKQDSYSKMESKKDRKIWKSKVLKKAFINNPVNYYKSEISCDFTRRFHSNVVSTLLKKNILRVWNKSLKEMKPILNTSTLNQNFKNKNDEADAPLDASNQVLKIPTNLVLKKYSKSLTRLTSFLWNPSVSVENCKKKSSDSQVAKEWMDTLSAADENNGYYEREMYISDYKTKSEESLESIVQLSSISETFVRPINRERGTSNENILPRDKESSEESFSLYYSKAADLASPLLDMKRFIYPDHIHYSYKHVKKKGFDVDINNGLPLIVRESLTMNDSTDMRDASLSPHNSKVKIMRRPMDLSFASTNSWQNFYSTDSETKSETRQTQRVKEVRWPDTSKEMKCAKVKNFKKDGKKSFKNNADANCDVSKRPGREICPKKSFSDSEKDDLLMEKLLKIYKKLNYESQSRRSESQDPTVVEEDHPPLQISSTQLHSNKGKIITSNYIPALVLNENKTRNEKKKMETLEERTMDMFARLKREILFQNKNYQKSFGSGKSF